MAMDYMQDAVALVVGGAHIWAKKHDMKEATPPEPLRGYVGYAAIGGVGLGLALSLWMPKYEKYGLALRLASWPFLAVELYNAVVSAPERITSQPRYAPGPVMVGPSRFGPARRVADQPGMEGVRLV